MKLSRVLALCTVLASTLCAAQQPKSFYLKSGDNVLTYGDSIAEQRLYSAIVEAFVATRYPSLNVSFVNSGWGGDTVYGGGGGPIDTRLKRDVFPYHPNVVTIMRGMNDGAYRPATDENDQKFSSGYRHIVESLRANLPGVRITAIKPSPYDNVTRPHASNGIPDFEYNEVLRGFGMWIGNYAEQEHLDTADMNTNVVTMLRNAYALDPETAKTIVPDRVHPSFAGHMVMAEELLKAWGARPVVSAVTIDASKPAAKIETATDAKITELSNHGSLSWTELDDALPLPFKQWEDMWGSGAVVTLVIKISDLTDALNLQILKVKGLHAGTYSVKIDGDSIGAFNSDEFAAGVNLALLKTPATEQAMKVYQLVVSQEDIHFDWWRHIEVPLADDGLQQSASAIDSMRALEGGIENKAHKAAQPAPHHFEVVPVQ
ncbi:MAG: SGNH/GDSL hydrolase family protein [Terracidiphilus sp.]|jgi:lysophospholipase L1-like esterase